MASSESSDPDSDSTGPAARPHPYGVRPMGNAWLATGEPMAARAGGLGRLALLNDELLLIVLGCMPAKTLCNLAQCSRALYGWAHLNVLWKACYLNDFTAKGQGLRYAHSWKDSYAAAATSRANAPPRSHVPRPCDVFSDVLYRPWLCSLPLQSAWLRVQSVDRRSGLSAASFVAEYETPNTPVIITDAVTDWPAFHRDPTTGRRRWDPALLAARHGDAMTHAGGYDLPLGEYLEYMRQVGGGGEDAPLYLFDKRFVATIPALGREYAPPPQFAEDLFGVLGDDHRPDWRWLIIGPRGSGSSFHVDPNGTSAWNAVITGAKRWIMYPPGPPPPGVFASMDGTDVASPLTLVEWFAGFHGAGARGGRRECTVAAGEVLFVPRGWWHLVVNLEPTVAVTHNYVSRANLCSVLAVLRRGRDGETALVSGVPPAERAGLYDRFVAALREHHPGLVESALDATAGEPPKRAASLWAEMGATEAPFQFGFGGGELQAGLGPAGRGLDSRYYALAGGRADADDMVFAPKYPCSSAESAPGRRQSAASSAMSLRAMSEMSESSEDTERRRAALRAYTWDVVNANSALNGERFFAYLLAESPELRPLFGRMLSGGAYDQRRAMQAHGKVMLGMVGQIGVDGGLRVPAVEAAWGAKLAALGTYHQSLGIRPSDHYPAFRASLMYVVQAAMGRYWDPNLSSAWDDALLEVITRLSAVPAKDLVGRPVAVATPGHAG